MFFGETTVEQLLDDSGVKLGTGVEVEAIDAFDRAEMRAFEASFESSGLSGFELGSKHSESEVGIGRCFRFGEIEQCGQLLGESRQVEIDSELNELLDGV